MLTTGGKGVSELRKAYFLVSSVMSNCDGNRSSLLQRFLKKKKKRKRM